MRIGILSDTHDQVERTAKAVAQLRAAGAEVLIHCGDLTIPEVVDECAGLPAYFVFGNNDDHQGKLSRAIAAIGGVCLGLGGLVELGNKRIAVTHGHSGTEMSRLERLQPDYLLFGHSHVPEDSRVGSTRYINPGALHRASEWTVALLDLDLHSLQLLTIQDKR